jgi:transposase InsO family protein
MPWKIKTEFRQRYDFIQQIRACGAFVAQVCKRFKVSRKTAYKWIGRYEQGGVRALQNRPPVARKQPGKIAAKWRRRVRQIRVRHRTWGPRKIRAVLGGVYGVRGLPSRSTIARWLHEWGLVSRRRQRRRSGVIVRWPRPLVARHPHDVWTADFKGWFRLGDGTRVEPLTVRDLVSRYVLRIQLLRQQNVEECVPIFGRLFREQGVPLAIRVDNGSPFGSKGPAGLTRLSAWWVKLGIRVEFIRPGHPEDNGAHEQLHRVLQAETANPPAKTMRGQDRRTQKWIREYNHQRPHEGIQMKRPRQLYRPNRRRLERQPRHWKYPKEWERRMVRKNGMMHWRGQQRFVGEAFGGQRIGLHEIRPGVWRVYYCQLLIGQLDEHGIRPATYRRAG